MGGQPEQKKKKKKKKTHQKCASAAPGPGLMRLVTDFAHRVDKIALRCIPQYGERVSLLHTGTDVTIVFPKGGQFYAVMLLMEVESPLNRRSRHHSYLAHVLLLYEGGPPEDLRHSDQEHGGSQVFLFRLEFLIISRSLLSSRDSVALPIDRDTGSLQESRDGVLAGQYGRASGISAVC